jgi:CDP-diacylglycerol--glycerol-3-phosphate 3-phosphatidyltransferase
MGKFFDPMADKLIHMTALVFLIPLGRIEAWLVVVLLSREIFINGLRSMAVGEGIVIDAATWGKRKTAWLNVGIGALIMHHSLFPGTLFEIRSAPFGYFCLWIGLIFSVASGVQYTVGFFRQMQKK